MREKRLLVAGSSNIDFILNTPYIPAPGETLISSGGYEIAPGGKGANSAVAASNFGAQVLFCSRVGDDAYGDRLIALFSERGIDTRCIRRDKKAQTGLASVMVEKSGTNRIIVFSGANAGISEKDVDDAFGYCPDAVLTQFEISDDAVFAAAKAAHDADIPLFVDAGPARSDFPLEKLEKVEILSPNENETEILTGIRPNSMENCLRACMALSRRVEAKYIVLKLGGRGCYVYDGTYCDLFTAYDAPVVDTTAAGDIFTAALTVEYLSTGSISKAAKFANAAGAISVGRHGSMSSAPSRAEVEEFLRNNL